MLSSVGNALRVLEALVEAGEAGVSDVARTLALTVGTTHRLLGSLVEAGFAEQNPSNRKYRPGPKIPALARKMRTGLDFGAMAHGRLEALGADAKETVNLGVLRDRSVVYVDRVASDQPLTVTVRIGSRVPAFCTALGKVLLAFGTDEEREGYLRDLKRIAVEAGYEPPDPERFAKAIETVRQRGYATDDGEFSADIACVAAPVLGPGEQVLAAVSISGLRTQIKERQDELREMVRSAAGEISELAATIGEDARL